MDHKVYRIVMSERCFRFKPDALANHAPRTPGVYEFVTFDAQMKPEVLYVGNAAPGTLYEALAAHLMGNKRPSADDLFRAAKDVYFDFVASLGPDVAGEADWKDVAGALILKHKPRLNPAGAPPSSGRYKTVELVELD